MHGIHGHAAQQVATSTPCHRTHLDLSVAIDVAGGGALRHQRAHVPHPQLLRAAAEARHIAVRVGCARSQCTLTHLSMHAHNPHEHVNINPVPSPGCQSTQELYREPSCMHPLPCCPNHAPYAPRNAVHSMHTFCSLFRKQLVRVIPPFLYQPNKCESMSLEHQGMWAEQSSFRASGRWLWLAGRCTYVHTSGPCWRPLPQPARVIWCQMCLLRCFGDKSERGKGRNGAGMVSPGVLARSTCAPSNPVRTPAVAPHAQRCVRQASTSTMVCLHGARVHHLTTCAPPQLHHMPSVACDRHRRQQWCAGEGAGRRR